MIPFVMRTRRFFTQMILTMPYLMTIIRVFRISILFHFYIIKPLLLHVFTKTRKKNKQIALQLMGWYYHGQQLKISWKPDNQHNARWRSSVVAIDRKTRRYFFQGNIYQEKGTDPVFLENLLFDCDLKNSRAAKAEFDRFIQEIKEQEREALLKLR